MQIAGEWIPITMFVGLAVVLSLIIWFRFRAQREQQETLRAAIDKGQELSPEVVERLTSPPPPPNRDLRRGLISLSLAAGFALFGIVLGEEDAVRPLIGVAMFPLSVGAGFLLVHRYASRVRG